MSSLSPSALLPAGLTDLLPPEAAHEADVVERLMATFAAEGYERVKPPLVEFETGLVGGAGQATAGQTFRLLDPVSQRMMGLRADITLQIARIAASRLKNAPRPLRLAYAGEVLRVKGSQLRPERQFTQVGVELIGSLRPEADAEVVLLAAAALRAVGVVHLSLDLNVPTLVPGVCRALAVPAEEEVALRQALDRKDAAAVAAVGGTAAPVLQGLMAASGTAERAMTALAALNLPDNDTGSVARDCHRLTEVVMRLVAADPDAVVTVDFVEHRGFEYQTGISFTLFSRGVRGELGRGGRYRAGAGTGVNPGADRAGAPATGFTLFLDSLLRAVPAPVPANRLYLPHGTPFEEAQRWRAEGWVTVTGLEPEPGADTEAEARRLNCGHRLLERSVHTVGER